MLQTVMEWHDYHLHEFRVRDVRIGMKDVEEFEEPGSPLLDERKWTVAEVVATGAGEFEYDFEPIADSGPVAEPAVTARSLRVHLSLCTTAGAGAPIAARALRVRLSRRGAAGSGARIARRCRPPCSTAGSRGVVAIPRLGRGGGGLLRPAIGGDGGRGPPLRHDPHGWWRGSRVGTILHRALDLHACRNGATQVGAVTTIAGVGGVPVFVVSAHDSASTAASIVARSQ